jgi:predicted nucleic acid-binding protein
MGERFLMDTSAVIKFLNESFPRDSLELLDKILDEDCVISFITQIELLAWDKPDEVLEVFKEFIAGSEILGIDQSIIERTIEIRKKSKIKVPDALIAATAIENNFTLVSDNDKDFKKVESFGLKYFNPKSYTSL